MDTDVSVQEVMDREFVGVSESDGLRETVELMVEEEVEGVVVLRGSEPVGVLTDRNALEYAVADGLNGATVADAMTESVPTVDPDVRLAEAAAELSARTTQRLVVTDGTDPVGVITEHDLMSTSPFSQTRAPDTGTEAVAVESVAPGAASTADREPDEPESATGRSSGFEDQAICEACGSLARDLMPFNGQLLCSDCRDI